MTATGWNVIFVIGDDLPPAAIERMPYLASRPEGHWVTLPNFVLSVPLCHPSRASLLTGLFPTQSGVAHNDSGDLPDDRRTWPAVLARHGYYNGLFGKYLNEYPEGWPNDAAVPRGWAVWDGFADQQLYYDQKVVRDGQRRQTVENSTDMTAAWAAEFVASAPEPFALYWAPVAPHSPTGGENMVAPRHADLYDGETPEHTPNFNPADLTGKPAWMLDRYPSRRNETIVGTMDAMRVNRWRALAAVDEGFEAIFAEVTARDAWDRTVVIWLGDNGNADGEYRVDDGKIMPYDICVNAQAMIRWPGAVQRTEPALVSSVDLAPTLCALAGGRMPQGTAGMDLAPLLDGRRTGTGWRRDVYTEWQPAADTVTPVVGNGSWITPWRCVVHLGQHGHVKYVSYQTGEQELYDLAADPYEMTNLAGDPAHVELLTEMQTRLAAVAP